MNIWWLVVIVVFLGFLFSTGLWYALSDSGPPDDEEEYWS